MKRIGIFGGTFNPPHVAHTELAENVVRELNLDKIIFIPSAIPPLKDKDKVLEIKHRLAMTEIAFGKDPNYEVSDIEIKNTMEKSYTIDTLIKLHEQYKNEDAIFFLIIGIDNLIDFPRWKNPKRLFELAKIVVMKRPDYILDNVRKEFLEKVVIVNTPLLDVSSTVIREKVKKNESIKSLVLPEIEKYIKQNNLYK